MLRVLKHIRQDILYYSPPHIHGLAAHDITTTTTSTDYALVRGQDKPMVKRAAAIPPLPVAAADKGYDNEDN